MKHIKLCGPFPPGQEGGARAGTECVPLIAGLGAAAAVVTAELPALAAHMRALRARLHAALAAALGAENVRVNGAAAGRLGPDDAAADAAALPNTLRCAMVTRRTVRTSRLGSVTP